MTKNHAVVSPLGVVFSLFSSSVQEERSHHLKYSYKLKLLLKSVRNGRCLGTRDPALLYNNSPLCRTGLCCSALNHLPLHPFMGSQEGGWWIAPPGYVLDTSTAHHRHLRPHSTTQIILERDRQGFVPLLILLMSASCCVSPVSHSPTDTKDGLELAHSHLHGCVLLDGSGHRPLGLQEGPVWGEEVHGKHQRSDHGRRAKPKPLRQHLHHDSHLGGGWIHCGMRWSDLQSQKRAGMGPGTHCLCC